MLVCAQLVLMVADADNREERALPRHPVKGIPWGSVLDWIFPPILTLPIGWDWLLKLQRTEVLAGGGAIYIVSMMQQL